MLHLLPRRDHDEGMRTYAEMDRLRKLARPLYLELRALDLEILSHEDPDTHSGYRLELVGLRSLPPSHADRLVMRVEEATRGLLKVMWVRWDEALEAIRGEGRA